MPWTKAEDDELRRLAKADDLFYTEIALKIGKPVQVVRWRARTLGLPKTAKHRMGSWNVKHAQISVEVMEFFQTHSAEETMLKFRLTKSEFKSLSTSAYSRGVTRHLRKDTRTHNKWTVEELLFLLRHAGIRPRSWIAEQIQRGNSRAIKEKLMSMKVNTKTLNGMTLSTYVKIFGRRPMLTVDGNAGPTRGCIPTSFKIVPWVLIFEEVLAGELKPPLAFRTIIETMARFQYWIHGSDPLRSLQRSAKGSHRPPCLERTLANGNAA
jgi:hypothetical protein